MVAFPRPARVFGLGAISAGLVLVGLSVPTTASATAEAESADSALLANYDVRDGMKGSSSPSPAALRLEASLGDEGFLTQDPQTGTVAFLGRSDSYLTPPSKADPAEIVKGYFREHRAAFGATSPDLATLGDPESYTAIDGVTHVTFPQVISGIRAFDTALTGNVDAKGRLINISATPAPGLSLATTVPQVSAEQALLAGRADVGGTSEVPEVKQTSNGPDRRVEWITYGESAKLVAFATPGADRLAWEVGVLDANDLLYRVVIDAETGKALARQSLTAFDSNDAAVWPNHPSAVQAPTIVNFGTDPTWLDRSAANGNQLIGNNAHAYHDDNGSNGYQAGEEVVRNPATATWTYPMTWFNHAGCPAFGCTWNSAVAGSKLTNRSAGTVGLFYLTNRFHDHLLAAPIGFTEASRNFEQVNSTGQGLGNDAVLAEASDSSGVNNANFSTPADGSPGRMQMFMWDGSPAAIGPQYDVDGSPSAEVVYHEYAHGLSNRLVGNGGGLGQLQSGAMGEAWSDFYALDLLVADGSKADPAGPGDVWMGEYATGVPGIFGGISRIRHQAIDCSVGAAAALCPASGTAGSGGYTYGDLGKVGTTNGVHDGGEIWSQTMWDLRTALGRTNALTIITGGMRLSPVNPSMLDMRNAILQSANVNGVSAASVWQVFAARGFGYFASTPSAGTNSATEDFSLPPALEHISTTINDDAPRGDGDGKAEPGETLAIATTLKNLTTSEISGVVGTASATNGIPVTRADSSWPSIAADAQVANDPPFAVTIPDIQPCGTNFTVSVAVNSPSGPVTVPDRLVTVAGTPDFTNATDVPKAIPDNNATGVNSLFTFPGAGTVSDLDVRISSLTHTWVGDLRMTLSHAGTTVVLMNRPGAGTNGSSGNDFTNLVLDDEAATTIESIPSTNPAGGYTGSYRPDESLSAFDGHSLAGTWTLNISDNAATDTGTLNSWAMSPVSNCEVFALPAVTTEPASGVTDWTARLNGSLDANGNATDFRFEYGTTPAYGMTTPVTAGGAGADPVALAADVDGLDPDTTYHFRLVALRGGVVVAEGADQSFTTLVQPDPGPAPTTAPPAPVPSQTGLPGTLPPATQPAPAPGPTTAAVVTLQTTSVFRTSSAKLSKAGKKALRTFVSQIPAGASPTTLVTGQVRATKASKAEVKRAAKRAKAVAKYLRTLRLAGPINVAGAPSKVVSKKKVNRVGITITYTR